MQRFSSVAISFILQGTIWWTKTQQMHFWYLNITKSYQAVCPLGISYLTDKKCVRTQPPLLVPVLLLKCHSENFIFLKRFHLETENVQIIWSKWRKTWNKKWKISGKEVPSGHTHIHTPYFQEKLEDSWVYEIRSIQLKLTAKKKVAQLYTIHITWQITETVTKWHCFGVLGFVCSLNSAPQWAKPPQ